MRAMPTYPSYDGAELAFREHGTGPALLVIPGGPARDAAYLGDLAALADGLQRTLVVPDLRGTGDSQPDTDAESHRADRIAADVAMLADHLRLAPTDVIAHSAGAERGPDPRGEAARSGLEVGPRHARDPGRRDRGRGRRLGGRAGVACRRVLVRRPAYRARSRRADTRAGAAQRGTVLRPLGRRREAPCRVATVPSATSPRPDGSTRTRTTPSAPEQHWPSCSPCPDPSGRARPVAQRPRGRRGRGPVP